MRHRRVGWVALRVVALAVLGCGQGVAAGPLPASATAQQVAPALPSPATRRVAAEVLATADHAQQPFAIVDKRAAVMTLFSAAGHVIGSTSVLLGSVRGDGSAPGVGERAQSGRLRPGDATTPAGRFVSTPGHNRGGEAVVWLDHGLAFAIHRLRPGASQAGRAQRLAAHNPARNRVSAGCVVVPVAFYDAVVQPLLGLQPGVVYVLPEQGDPLGFQRKVPR